MSGRMYSWGYPGATLLRIDPREEKPVITELTEPVPLRMRAPKYERQSSYKFNCMAGADHPLDLAVDDYELVTVASCTADSMISNSPQRSYGDLYKFNQDEIEFIQSVCRQPKVEWAIDNSFDGLYIQKEFSNADYMTHFKFSVYLKIEQATFWKLKYHGC